MLHYKIPFFLLNEYVDKGILPVKIEEYEKESALKLVGKLKKHFCGKITDPKISIVQYLIKPTYTLLQKQCDVLLVNFEIPHFRFQD